MEHESSNQMKTMDIETTSQSGSKIAVVWLVLTSLGFLVLEATACALSKRSDAWRAYPWFFVAVAGGIALLAVLLWSSGKHQLAQTFLHNLMAGTVSIYAITAVIYLLYLLSLGQTADMIYVIVVPLLVLIPTGAVMVRHARKAFGSMKELLPRRAAKIPVEQWKAAAAAVSFALVIVLAFAWSWTSPIDRIAPLWSNTQDYHVLGGIIDAMWRLLLLSVIHGVFLYLSGVCPLPARVVQAVSWSALAVWRYAPSLLAAVEGPGRQYSFFWTLSTVVPIIYASILLSRLLTAIQPDRGARHLE